MALSKANGELFGAAATLAGEKWTVSKGKLLENTGTANYAGTAFDYAGFANVLFKAAGTARSNNGIGVDMGSGFRSVLKVTKTGRVEGFDDGVSSTGDEAKVVNGGKISSTSGDGVVLGGAQAKLFNKGTITATSAVVMDGDFGVVIDQGVIKGDVIGGTGTTHVTNTGKIVGDVNLGDGEVFSSMEPRAKSPKASTLATALIGLKAMTATKA